MLSSKDAVIIFVVISFLVIALIFSSSATRFVQAVPVSKPECTYDYSQFLPTRSCCWTDEDTQFVLHTLCEVCTYQPDGSYGDCKTTEGPAASTHKQPPTTPPPSAGSEQPPSPQPPKNALPPSTQQTTCPDGSAPKGKCLTTTTNQQVAPPSKHHHKASS